MLKTYQTEVVLQNPAELKKKRKDISRHTIVKLLKIKIEKEMSARGREETYIKQKGAII